MVYERGNLKWSEEVVTNVKISLIDENITDVLKTMCNMSWDMFTLPLRKL